MPIYINAKDLANAIDLSERRVNQLVSEGVIIKEMDGNFDVMR